jgi:hypothetical protein
VLTWNTTVAGDGTPLHFATAGNPANPAIFLGPYFFPSWIEQSPLGTSDPTAGWVEGLEPDFFLVLADYPRGIGRTGQPVGLRFTPDFMVDEYLRIADAAEVRAFGWMGYSWGAAMGWKSGGSRCPECFTWVTATTVRASATSGGRRSATSCAASSQNSPGSAGRCSGSRGMDT